MRKKRGKVCFGRCCRRVNEEEGETRMKEIIRRRNNQGDSRKDRKEGRERRKKFRE